MGFLNPYILTSIMGFLFDDRLQPGDNYWLFMFAMMTVMCIVLIVHLIMTVVNLVTKKSGFSSLPRSDLAEGIISAGRALRNATKTSDGPPGGLVSYSTFVNPEPPVFYNIGDVDATRAYQTGAASVSEGYGAPTIGLKKGFTNPVAYAHRWGTGFTDQDLLKY